MKRLKIFLRLLSFWLYLICFCSYAQDNNAIRSRDVSTQSISKTTKEDSFSDEKEITIEDVDSVRKQIESDTAIADLDKKKAIELCDQAVIGLKDYESLKIADKAINDAPLRIAEIRKILSSTKSNQANLLRNASGISVSPKLSSPNANTSYIETYLPNLSLNQIETGIAELSSTLNKQKEDLRKREEELSELSVGTKSLTEKLAEKTKLLEQINADISVSTTSGELKQLQQAQMLALNVRRHYRLAEVELLKKRLSSSFLTDLAQSERDLLIVQISQLEQSLNDLRQRGQEIREAKAISDREKAEKEAHVAHQAMLPSEAQNVANENMKFRKELEELVNKDKEVDARLQEAGQQLEDLRSEFEKTRQRVDVIGQTAAIGRMLHRRRIALPSIRSYRQQYVERVEMVSKATDRQLEIDDLIQRSAVIEQSLQDALTKAGSLSLDQNFLSSLMQARRDSLNELQKMYGRYMTKLTNLDISERQLASLADTYTSYMEDQLLWLPSVGLLSLFTERNGLSFVDLHSWSSMIRNLYSFYSHHLEVLIFAIVVLSFLLTRKDRIQMQINGISVLIRKIKTDSFYLSLKALILNCLCVLQIPLVLLVIGFPIYHLSRADELAYGVGNGLVHSALFYGLSDFLYLSSKKGGFGEIHLKWKNSFCLVMQSILPKIKTIGSSLAFLVFSNCGFAVPLQSQAIGVLAFICLMFLFSVLSIGLVKKRFVVLHNFALNEGDSHTTWRNQISFLYVFCAIVIPIVLACLSAFGYHYTSLRLWNQIELSIAYLLAFLLCRDLILRWLFITERKLRYDNLLRRREEAREQRERNVDNDTQAEDLSAFSVDIPEINYDSLSEQSKRLVSVGFLFACIIGAWSIWSSVLPTVGFISNATLPFKTTRIIDGVSREVPVTFENLFMGIFLLVLTVVSARNLPGLLEISLLQRLPIDPGARYAITALSQYIIFAIGLVFAFVNIGLEWTSIQWLLAALSVGLGFGLQEIVANFVSGIILLFERPIRVGDIVTIDGTTGLVSKIRIRATTITNYDRQELIVPNKEFITSKLVNWTLTDNTNRISIPIGVAYGTNIQSVMDLLMNIAYKNPNVMRDPKPLASFEGFGESSLLVVLRCYLENMDNRTATITALHLSINETFEKNGINIAFPQRNVNLVFDKPIAVRIHDHL